MVQKILKTVEDAIALFVCVGKIRRFTANRSWYYFSDANYRHHAAAALRLHCHCTLSEFFYYHCHVLVKHLVVGHTDEYPVYFNSILWLQNRTSTGRKQAAQLEGQRPKTWWLWLDLMVIMMWLPTYGMCISALNKDWSASNRYVYLFVSVRTLHIRAEMLLYMCTVILILFWNVLM